MPLVVLMDGGTPPAVIRTLSAVLADLRTSREDLRECGMESIEIHMLQALAADVTTCLEFLELKAIANLYPRMAKVRC